MNEWHTPTSSHSTSLSLSLDDCSSSFMTWQNSLTWVEHGIFAASGYKERPGFAAIGWETSRGGFHDSAAAAWHGSSFSLFYPSAHPVSLTTSLSYLLQSNLTPSVSCSVSSRSSHTTHCIYEMLLIWYCINRAMVGRDKSFIFVQTKSWFCCEHSRLGLNSPSCLFLFLIYHKCM